MKWNRETRKIKDLHEYAKNPRTLSKEQGKLLQESLTKFGQCEPLVINTDGTIVGGHQRLRTLRKMGTKEVDVYVPDTTLTEKEVEELCIRLNKNVGSWDFDMLGNAWDPSDLVDWGFDMEELHLEELPGSEESESNQEPKICSMNIKFANIGHLQEAEDRISLIVDEYTGASYKVKIT